MSVIGSGPATRSVGTVQVSQVVLPCTDIEATAQWFADACGFRLLMITPADDPSIAVLGGHGLHLRLDRSAPAGPSRLRLAVESPGPELVGPNGTVVEWVPTQAALDIPPNDPVFVLNRHADATRVTGRAGMSYRDLLPQRQGGRFIASHIHIPNGGPVPDYVHHHDVRFQMIFCHRGSAELVYEDQGAPFTFEAGDCVLQPPHIRHQVLSTSDEFEAVEIGCPAIHDTLRDHDLQLPTGEQRPTRDFSGQRFVWHRSAQAHWQGWRSPGFTRADFGIADATQGLADASVVRPSGALAPTRLEPTEEFLFWFIREGTATLARAAERHRLAARDSVVFAPGEQYELLDPSTDLEFLEVRVP